MPCTFISRWIQEHRFPRTVGLYDADAVSAHKSGIFHTGLGGTDSPTNTVAGCNSMAACVMRRVRCWRDAVMQFYVGSMKPITRRLSLGSRHVSVVVWRTQ